MAGGYVQGVEELGLEEIAVEPVPARRQHCQLGALLTAVFQEIGGVEHLVEAFRPLVGDELVLAKRGAVLRDDETVRAFGDLDDRHVLDVIEQPDQRHYMETGSQYLRLRTQLAVACDDLSLGQLGGEVDPLEVPGFVGVDDHPAQRRQSEQAGEDEHEGKESRADECRHAPGQCLGTSQPDQPDDKEQQRDYGDEHGRDSPWLSPVLQAVVFNDFREREDPIVQSRFRVPLPRNVNNVFLPGRPGGRSTMSRVPPCGGLRGLWGEAGVSRGRSRSEPYRNDRRRKRPRAPRRSGRRSGDALAAQLFVDLGPIRLRYLPPRCLWIARKQQCL